MERYAQNFSSDPNTWAEVIKEVDALPFECVGMLGHGAQCSVHSIAPLEEDNGSDSGSVEDSSEAGSEFYRHWTEVYFDMNDVDGEISEDSEDSESDDQSGSGSGSEEWTRVGDEPPASSTTHTTIITPSPMGPVEVVAKRFSHVNDDKCIKGTDPTTGAQLMLHSSSGRYVDWLVDNPGPVTTTMLSDHITPTVAAYTEFVNESLCHLLISDLVSAGLTPHITMAFRALRCHNTGFLIQERITATLEEVLETHPNLGAQDIAAFYFQILIALVVMQRAAKLKHHDLHTDNVFVKQIDDTMEWKGVKLASATHFAYRLDPDTVITIPNSGFLIKVGDFGMCSLDVYGRRLQRLDMETFAEGTGWGDWTPAFDTYEGYDSHMLMGAPPFEPDSWRVEDADTTTFMRHMRRVALGPNGKITRSRLRPMPGHISRVTPFEVIKGVFVDAPGDVYNFRVDVSSEPSTNVVWLGDLTMIPDIDTTPIATPTGRTTGRKRRRRGGNRVTPTLSPPPPSI